MLRASYDRVFETPPIENLLLSSSSAAQTLRSVEGFLPVPVVRANFYEVGFRKPVGSVLRLDVNHYWRAFSNYYDDDVFLNTGIGFPISFEGARIEGTEVRLEMPHYRGLSAYLSYSNMLGTATSPVTGGLFIAGGEGVRAAPAGHPLPHHPRPTKHPQPARTVRVCIRGYEFPPRPVTAAACRSSLPTMMTRMVARMPTTASNETEPDEDDNSEAAGGLIPAQILERVNLSRGRVRPNFQLDLSVGVKIWEQDERSVDLQFDITNATDRLNVINFTGLFSGTAIAPGRMIGVRLRTRF